MQAQLRQEQERSVHQKEEIKESKESKASQPQPEGQVNVYEPTETTNSGRQANKPR
jgi:hypothetical protein